MYFRINQKSEICHKGRSFDPKTGKNMGFMKYGFQNPDNKIKKKNVFFSVELYGILQCPEAELYLMYEKST